MQGSSTRSHASRLSAVAAASVAVALALTALAGSPADAATITPDDAFSGDGRTAFKAAGSDTSTDIVVTGTSSYLIGNVARPGGHKGSRIAVVKHGLNGKVSESFGTNGRRTILVGRTSKAFSGTLAPDGGVLVAGVSKGANSAIIVAKLRPGGRLDSTFSGDGIARFPVKGGIEWPLIEVQPDGGIWVAWAAVKQAAHGRHVSDFRVIHLTKSGRLNDGFGGDGQKTFDLRRKEFTYFSQVDSNGRFYVAGYGSRNRKADGVTTLLSIADDGPNYSRTLKPWAKYGSAPINVGVTASGHVVVGLTPVNAAAWGAARLTPQLKLDRTYGRDGFARHSCECISMSGAQTTKGLVLIGTTQQQEATIVARFTTNGRWDRQLDNKRINLFSSWEYWFEAVADAQDRTVLAGTTRGSQGAGDMAIARLKFGQN
jgi:uncharacterized delta-60 repeat protein